MMSIKIASNFCRFFDSRRRPNRDLRNRVSLPNLCHQPTTVIETRFLGWFLGWLQRSGFLAPRVGVQKPGPEKPGFFGPNLCHQPTTVLETRFLSVFSLGPRVGVQKPGFYVGPGGEAEMLQRNPGFLGFLVSFYSSKVKCFTHLLYICIFQKIPISLR
jgi:hypothetical protein